ncbi:hypothetical protein FKM82_009632 [Ascaphus truei]
MVSIVHMEKWSVTLTCMCFCINGETDSNSIFPRSLSFLSAVFVAWFVYCGTCKLILLSYSSQPILKGFVCNVQYCDQTAFI